MKRRILASLAGLCLAFAAAPVGAQPAPAYDPEAWVGDLAQVRAALSDHYANLEWAFGVREAPMPQLFAQAESRLRAARGDAEAREVFNRFAEYLGDGHVRVDWPSPAAAASAGGPAPVVGPCEALGFKARSDRTAVAADAPGYTPLQTAASGYFPAGTFELDGRRIGVVRIAAFGHRDQPAACAEALAGMKLAPTAPCDEACRDRLDEAAAAVVTRALETQLRAVRAAGAQTLVVDIAGNGGGNDWVEAAARMVTPVRLSSARVGFIRHAHWREALARKAENLDEALREAAPADRPLLRRLKVELAKAQAEAARRCDPAPLWTGGAPDCPVLGTAELFSSGLLASADPAWLKTRPWAAAVFSPARYPYMEGAWDGPLVVLVDQRTASASEEFSALLQDARAAVVLGAPTAGAGCGYTDGGVPTPLAHSGGVLRLPDCARLRADGSNEVGGVDPDVLVGFRPNDGRRARAQRFLKALPEALRRAEAQAAARPRAVASAS